MRHHQNAIADNDLSTHSIMLRLEPINTGVIELRKSHDHNSMVVNSSYDSFQSIGIRDILIAHKNIRDTHEGAMYAIF